jgi:hypothetical protein
MEFSCAPADVVSMAIAIRPADKSLIVVIELLLSDSDATKLGAFN